MTKNLKPLNCGRADAPVTLIYPRYEFERISAQRGVKTSTCASNIKEGPYL